MTQYYKVVDKYHDGYFSVYAAGRFFTKYNINEWTEATTGGLLVFENLEAAKTFVNNRRYFHIFKCEVEQPVDLPPYRSDSGMWRSDFIAKFWDKNISVEGLRWDTASSISVEISQWPDHTAAFKRVKITEQIYP
jgi:hypothetical protein